VPKRRGEKKKGGISGVTKTGGAVGEEKGGRKERAFAPQSRWGGVAPEGGVCEFAFPLGEGKNAIRGNEAQPREKSKPVFREKRKEAGTFKVPPITH